MDLSSLSECHKLQQQQQQEIQKQDQNYASQSYDPMQTQSYEQWYYSYYQQQQQQPLQQQGQNHASQSYDPTQSQSYEQWYYSYYQQQQQQQQQRQDGQQRHYAAYYQQPKNSMACQNTPRQQHSETVSLNPPGVPISVNKGAQTADAGGAYPVQQQQSTDYSGLNPEAAATVAALSQLARFAGTMNAAERALAGLQAAMGQGQMHPSVNQFPYNCNGGPSRGRGFGPSFRGRRNSQGRGAPKRFLQQGGSSTSSHPESSTTKDEALTYQNKKPSTDAPGEASQKVEPNRKPGKPAWCEICRVECTSLEILEQHKNGKRHKKNLQKIEELQKAVKPITKVENVQKTIAERKPEVSQQPEFSQGGEVIKLAENLPTESIPNTMDKQLEVSANEHCDLPEGNSRMDPFNNRTRGTKRKIRGGRGEKRLKSFSGPTQQMQPPKPKVVIPLICDLCNVKCDTQEVLDRHLSGKKHIAKLKRYEDHQAIYGPTGLQALYPPNPLAQTFFHPQSHQHQAYDSQASYPLTGMYLHPQTDQSQQYHLMPQAETTARSGV